MVSGGKLREEIYEIIRESWPVHISGICRKMNIKDNLPNISKLRYHIGILRNNNKVNTKKIDRALVIWPVEVEKLKPYQFF
jgi:predicted transcriptional regulator